MREQQVRKFNPGAKLKEHLLKAKNREPAKARSPESQRGGEVLEKRILIPTSAALGMRGQTRAVKSKRSRRGANQDG